MKKLFPLLLALFLAHPAVAVAQNAPPGNSEIDQYTETLPNGQGNGPVDDSDGGNDASAVPPSAAAGFQSEGAVGSAAQNFAESTAPDQGLRSLKADRRGSQFAGASSDSESGSPSGSSPEGSGLSGLIDTLTGDNAEGGTGLLLPLALTGIAMAGVAAVFIRKQRVKD